MRLASDATGKTPYELSGSLIESEAASLADGDVVSFTLTSRSTSETRFASGDHRVTYGPVYPNGEDCGEGCKVATL